MVNGEDHGAQVDLDGGVFHAVDKALGVFGAGELLFKVGEAKAGVDALTQDAAELCVALDDRCGSSGIGSLECRRHTGRAAADNNDVVGDLVHLIIALHGTENYFGARVLQENLSRGYTQLAGQNVHDAALAKTALATAHSGPATALDALDRGGTGRAVDSGNDFCFGNGFAAADDASPCGVAADKLVLTLSGRDVEIFWRAADGVEIWVWGQGDSCVTETFDHIFRDGRGAGDAGRLDARCLEQMGLNL